MTKHLNIIFACNQNGVIGKDNTIPWKISKDLKFFKQITLNKIIIMGRKTFESIGSKPLKDRINIVITSNPAETEYENLIYADSLQHAVEIANDIKSDNNEIFIIGGKKLIEDALPFADTIYRTLVNYDINDDSNTVKVSRVFEDYTRCVFYHDFEENNIKCNISVFSKKTDVDQTIDKLSKILKSL
jgi:dihydrofolate reductase